MNSGSKKNDGRHELQLLKGAVLDMLQAIQDLEKHQESEWIRPIAKAEATVKNRLDDLFERWDLDKNMQRLKDLGFWDVFFKGGG